MPKFIKYVSPTKKGETKNNLINPFTDKMIWDTPETNEEIIKTPSTVKTKKTIIKENNKSEIIASNIEEIQKSPIIKAKLSDLKDFGFIKKVSVKQRLESSGDKKTIAELRNVDVTFGRIGRQTRAIDDMSLNIYRGEVLGLVGESGSGKSTTGNAILGLVNRSKGSIKVKGHEVPQKSKKVVGKERQFLVENVQMIFQDPASSLNPYKTIEKVIGEGLDNVDVFKLYSKNFDNETISDLIKILENTNTKTLGDNKLTHYVEMSNNGKHKEVEKIIYVDLKNELMTLGTPTATLALDYLKVREKVKKNTKNENSSTKKLKKKLIVETMNSVGLTEAALNRYPLEFSGGQQQRVGISRAVILQPELLIADEPISALDVSIQAQVINIFNDLKEKLGLTFLFIAHDLRMVEYISDRIAVMYKGKLLEIGDAEEIIKNPLHPYTRSLTDSIPSINDINKSLKSKAYNTSQHNYNSSNKPEWFSVSKTDKEHFVFGTKEEIIKWSKNRNGGE